MKQDQVPAIGSFKGLGIDEAEVFVDVCQPMPEHLTPRDLLVKVQAVSVNPVDTKLRQNLPESSTPHILGFDAVGQVVKTGSDATKFKVGDRVFYAGSAKRAGSNQSYQLVDERLVALAPHNLTDEEAAALPLTSLTASELLFDKFHLTPEKNAHRGKSLLIINGAGGVGSVMTQLAKWLGLTVIATASPKKFDWLKENGTDYPLDYKQGITSGLKKIGIDKVDYIAVLHNITPYFEELTQIIQPFGHIGTIVAIDQKLDIGLLKNLSVSFDWEYMFAKTDYGIQLESQGQMLSRIAELVEKGEVRSTVTKIYGDGIHAANLKRATKDVETGHMTGKVVVSGPFNTLN